MHKLSVIAILLVAVLAVEAASTRRGYYRRGSRPLSRPFTQFDARGRGSFPVNNFVSMPGPRPFNYGMPFGGPAAGLGRGLPDGEYRTMYGIASVDGSDVSMDAY